MESKRLLRFYFSVDRLDKALNNLITQKAISSAVHGSNGAEIGQEMCVLIQAKKELSELWNYLDSILKAFSEDEIKSLHLYGTTKLGIKQLPLEAQRHIKKSVVKFTRRARNLDRYESGVRLVNRYYGLL